MKPAPFIVTTIIWVLIVILLAPMLGESYSTLTALLLVSLLYWLGCWVLTWRFADKAALKALYRKPINRQPFTLVLTWLPAIATFMAVFWHAAPQLPVSILLAILAIALMNGLTEELFWRGVFITHFPSNIRLGLFLPLLVFTAWHVALLLIPGVHYQGGAPALLGGALYMGLSWGWVVWRTGDIRSVSIAHVLANTFAFSGLVLDNGLSP